MFPVTKYSPSRGGPLRAGPLAPPAAPRPKLLGQVRDAIRTRHYSYRTEQAYIGWIKRFVFFHHKRHPAEMGKAEIGQFLTALAVKRQVSASTQNQAGGLTSDAGDHASAQGLDNEGKNILPSSAVQSDSPPSCGVVRNRDWYV